jgi:hypothetical protein
MIIRIAATIIVSYSIRKLSKSISRKEDKGKIAERSGNVYVNVTKINNNKEKDELEEPNYNKKEIVGIVKPIGRFTSMIMGQKITYMMQHADELKKINDSAYHKVMMNSHDKTAARGAARG